MQCTPQSLQNILLSQCWGLKQALAMVCHFLNVLCWSFLLGPYFQGFVHWWEIHLLCSVSMFVYNQHSFPLHTDWPKLTALFVDGEPQGHWRWNSNSRDMTAGFLSFFASPPDRPGRACSQATYANVQCLNKQTVLDHPLQKVYQKRLCRY